jgi:hypothetical protein
MPWATPGNLTPFARAAGRRLLVVEASGVGARGACQWIKGLAAAGAGSLEVAVSGARDRADATALFASLNDFTERHVGLPLVWRGEVERDGAGRFDDHASRRARHPAEGAQCLHPAAAGLVGPGRCSRLSGCVFVRYCYTWVT